MRNSVKGQQIIRFRDFYIVGNNPLAAILLLWHGKIKRSGVKAHGRKYIIAQRIFAQGIEPASISFKIGVKCVDRSIGELQSDQFLGFLYVSLWVEQEIQNREITKRANRVTLFFGSMLVELVGLLLLNYSFSENCT